MVIRFWGFDEKCRAKVNVHVNVHGVLGSVWIGWAVWYEVIWYVVVICGFEWHGG